MFKNIAGLVSIYLTNQMSFFLLNALKFDWRQQISEQKIQVKSFSSHCTERTNFAISQNVS